MEELIDAARRVVESTYRKNTRMHPMPGAIDDLEAALDGLEWTQTPEKPGIYVLDAEGIPYLTLISIDDLDEYTEVDGWRLFGPIPIPDQVTPDERPWNDT